MIGPLCFDKLFLVVLDFEQLLMQGVDLLPQLVILRPELPLQGFCHLWGG